MKKDISERGAPFFCVSRGLSNKQKIFFGSYTLQGDGVGSLFC